MADPLARYRQKRNFALTPEPEPASEPSPEDNAPAAGALQYVVQKHWAGRLHYDLRLELDGSMKSWAVPKGPSLDPADKRMAVQVEDHPLSYNRFEGQIPAKQYGAGKVIVWDRGHWSPVGDAAEGYHQGRLKFDLHGHKLQGRWTLVRLKGRRGEPPAEKQPPWLLIKERDDFARPAGEFSVVDALPDSVLSLPPLAPPAVSVASPAIQDEEGLAVQGRRAPLPTRLSPPLASLVDHPPEPLSDWLWELKFDGYRLLSRIEAGQVQLLTRNGHDWTARMPSLVKALKQLPLESAWLDGEVLVLDAHGVPDFQALQNAFDSEVTQDLVYCLFDMPYADGQDLRQQPLVARRARLQALVAGSPSERVRFSEAFDAKPEDLLQSARTLGFEGLIGKRRSSPYLSKRSTDWVKLKCSLRQEFVLVGFTDPQGTRSGIGALLLGIHQDNGSLRYAGKVGTGFTEHTLKDLHQRLSALVTTRPAVADAPAATKGVHWVRPILLAEVSFAQWTAEHRIRHAVFHGLREDKPAKGIVRELPSPAAATGRLSTTRRPASATTGQGQERPTGVPVSNPDRVIDPSTGITKLELVRYYDKVAPLLMPHLKGRPVSLVRAPDGVGGALFFQKHLHQGSLEGVLPLDTALYPGHPALLELVKPAGLRAAAQMNVVEFHTWNARKDRIERPDRMGFDLDPGEGVPWEQVQEAAQLVHVLLEELGLPTFLKTSGGKGLHVIVPVKRLHSWTVVKGFSQAVVNHLADTIPQRFVAKSGPQNRIGKVFVDYLRNGRGATTVSAWSARARPGMGISVPLAWSELAGLVGSAHWTIRSVDQRLRQGNTPWEAHDKAAVSLTAAMKTLGYRGG